MDKCQIPAGLDGVLWFPQCVHVKGKLERSFGSHGGHRE